MVLIQINLIGEYTQPDGESYKGEWRDDKHHGKGKSKN